MRGDKCYPGGGGKWLKIPPYTNNLDKRNVNNLETDTNWRVTTLAFRHDFEAEVGG